MVGRGPSQRAAPVLLGSLSFSNFSLNDSPTSQQPKHPHPSPTPLGKVHASFVNRMGFVNEMPPVGPAGQGTGTSNSRRGFLELDHKPGPASPGRAGWGVVRAGAGLTLETPDMMMVLFFRGGLSFSFEDSLSCRMATSATGSEPFSTNSSAGEAAWTCQPKPGTPLAGPGPQRTPCVVTRHAPPSAHGVRASLCVRGAPRQS